MQNKESIYPQDWFLKGDNDLNAAEILLKAGNLQFLVSSELSKDELEKVLSETEGLIKFIREAIIND